MKNKKGLIIALVVIAVIAIFAGSIVSSYNSLVDERETVTNAQANIQTMLQRRADLIPNLVNTVKGYAAHEKGLLESVTAARTAAMSAKNIEDKMAADQMLTSALAGLKVSVEAYPDLKANQNFMQLQQELSDIENKLAAVRRFFNSATRELNNAVQTFPGNLLAGMFGFHTEKMYEIEASQRAAMDKAPEISF